MEDQVTASEAIVKGLGRDGGLFVPKDLPKMTKSLMELKDLSYQDLAYEVMSLFFDDFTEEELRYCINHAYDHKFDTTDIAPTVKVGDAYLLELFHGKTIAFKDMALSILPYLMKTAAKKLGITNDIVILTATSGDTGKAALEGFADVHGTHIIVFYPKDGVSPVQKRQMVTQKGDNTHVVGIDGNFDDAQNGVKAIFANESLKAELADKGFQFSSANSINIGRLVPQVVYYFYTYLTLLNSGDIVEGEMINVSVPTGNFGNILAAYYAKSMGLPIKTLICASNDNKVLYDFMNTGTYDRKREFVLTISPSMDILISSNLERLIYLISGEDTEATKGFMDELVHSGEYTVSDTMKAALKDFVGGYLDQEGTKETISDFYEETGYLMDPHTAVGYGVYANYRIDSGDTTKTVVASTASPYKFTKSTMSALKPGYAKVDDFDLFEPMHEASGVELPEAITELLDAPIRHDRHCEAAQMEATVRDILGL